MWITWSPMSTPKKAIKLTPSLTLSFLHSFTHSFSQSINQSVNQSTNQPTNQSIHLSINSIISINSVTQMIKAELKNLLAMIWGLFYWHGSISITAWISNHMPGKVWDEITYPFQKFSGCTVQRLIIYGIFKGRHCIFWCNFFREQCHILIQISLQLVPEGAVNNQWTLPLAMAWPQRGDRPLPDPKMTTFIDACISHQASVSYHSVVTYGQTCNRNNDAKDLAKKYNWRLCFKRVGIC